MDLTFSLESLRKELQVVLTSDDMPSVPTDDDLEYEEQDNPTLFDIVRKNPKMTYNEATKVQEETRLAKEAKVAKEKEGVKKYKTQNRPLTDTMDERAYYELKNENQKLRKRVHEAEGEMTIVKGIGMNSPEMKDAKARIKELENSLSIALEINENQQRWVSKVEDKLKSQDYTRQHDYKFLVDENKKLHKEIDDLKRGEEKRINKAREAGF